MDLRKEEHDTIVNDYEDPSIFQENVLLRRSMRILRLTISDDYIIFLGEDYTESVNNR